MANQRARRVVAADLRRRYEAELAAREAAEEELRATLAAKKQKGWRSWRWVGQLSAILTALTAVGALVYTGQGLAQSQTATVEQNRLAESGQITDRFNAAVTNLGSTTMTIRLGGIYALQRIMNDSPSDQPAVDQVLAAFIRSQQIPGLPATAKRPGVDGPVGVGNVSGYDDGPPSIDIQAALTVLATRDPDHDGPQPIDLHYALLRRADLTGAHFDGADLRGVDLSFTNLSNAHLAGADFSDTSLGSAQLTGAHLDGAKLDDVYLVGANLTGVDLDGVDLSHTNLVGVDLAGTNYCAGARVVHPGLGYLCTP